ncbi:hypothetical protein [Acinetobacter tandoii]|uniref:hypothetical protein n=1 Tax=Acinetobacter tandoii TaxID=202954 RepID=UPI000C20B451
MHSKKMTLALLLTALTAHVYAEPAAQSGDSVDSLAGVKIMTTVNGQPGSLAERMAGNKTQAAVEATQAPTEMVSVDAIDAPIPQ